MGGVVGGIAGAVLGGVAGSQKDKASVSSSSSNVNTVLVDTAGAQETAAQDTAFKQIDALNKRLLSLESSPVLNNLDRLMAELGQSPSAERIQQAQAFAQNVYAPQQESLQQAFQDQQVNFAQRAAQMGRSSADPILAAKLAQEQIRQQKMLEAEKTNLTAQESINAPLRQFQNQLSALGGLSQQAIQNRQAVFGLGSDFANTMMNYRLATATRTGTTNETRTSVSGGGLKGVLTGAFGGAQSGFMMGNGIGGGGGSGAGGSGQPGMFGGTGVRNTPQNFNY